MKIIISVMMFFMFFSLYSRASDEEHKARVELAGMLQKALFCQPSNGKEQTGDDEQNRFLKSAGATLKFRDAPVYNNYEYSFKEPLHTASLLLYSVRQDVGEGGVIFISEVSGPLSNLVEDNDLQPAKEDGEFLGVESVLFYKRLAGNEFSDSDDSSDYTKFIIGQTAEQKLKGRFFLGCVRAMNM